MKKLILVLLISFGLLNCNYAQSCLWANFAGGAGYDEGKDISIDVNGNVCVTGNFKSSIITFGTTTLTPIYDFDIFIVKYDPSGNVLWAKSAGGNGADYETDISNDMNGNIFVTGSFSGSTISFGTTTLTNANVGYPDIFIVKYDASGNVLWAKSAGGSSADEGYSISTDASSNVFLTGGFDSYSITFDTTTLINAYSGDGNGDIFILKFDALGNILWSKSAGGSGDDRGYGISTDASGNVFVTGIFDSPSITFGATILTNTGVYVNFIVQYDASGNVVWVESVGGSISTDASGNIFVTGNFSDSTITFGTTTLTNTSTGSNDIFIVKYDASGNLLWAKSAGGSGYDYRQGISTDASGNVFVTGYFASPRITFGTTTLTNKGTGNYDIFIVKYDASGNVLWAKSEGGSDYDYGWDISTDASGNVFVIGDFFSPTITFDSTTLTNAGSADIFIVKLDGSSVTSVIGGNNNSISANVYPNPFISSATLKIEMLNPSKATVALSDVTGKIVHYFGQAITLNAGENTFAYPENLSPGVYVIKVFTEDAVESLKCVKVE